MTPDRPSKLAPEKGSTLPHHVQVPAVEAQLGPSLEDRWFTQDEKVPSSAFLYVVTIFINPKMITLQSKIQGLNFIPLALLPMWVRWSVGILYMVVAESYFIPWSRHHICKFSHLAFKITSPILLLISGAEQMFAVAITNQILLEEMVLFNNLLYNRQRHPSPASSSCLDQSQLPHTSRNKEGNH